MNKLRFSTLFIRVISLLILINIGLTHSINDNINFWFTLAVFLYTFIVPTKGGK